MVWEYQAFGNAGLVRGIFDGVKGIISTPEYTTLIILLSLASFFYLVPAKALAGKMSEVLLYILTIVVGVQLIFSSTMDVRIIDRLGATAPVVSTDIPIGIGVPITAINSIGWEITQWYETNMATNIPVALKLSHGAPFNAGSKILQDMNSVRIVDPVLSSKVTNYIRDCKLPEIMVDPTEYTRWFQNADIFDSLASTNNVRFTKGGGGVVKTCKVAFDEIKVIFDAPADNPAGWFSNFKNSIGLNNNASVSALQGSASSLMTNAAVLDAVTSQISGGNFTSNQFFVGNLISPQINDAISNAALLTGSDEILTSMNIEQGRKAQSAGWVTAAILFQDMAGYLFSALNLLVIGLSPIMILGIFIPKFGTKIVSSFVKVLVWLALWWPGLALVNHISTSFLMSQVTGETMLDYSAAMPWQGASASLLSAYGSNATMASGFLATVIPMIMWSLITGSGQAFTAALQGASGRAEAQGAAKGIASNSYEEGKIGYNNVSANKMDNSSTMVTGDQGMTNHRNAGAVNESTSYSGITQNEGGKDTTPTITSAKALSAQDAASKTTSVLDAHGTTLSEAGVQGAASAEGFIDSFTGNKTMSSQEGAKQTELDSRQTAAQMAIQATAGATTKESEGASSSLTGSIGAGFKLGVGGKEGVSNYLNSKGSKEDALAAAKQDMKDQGLDDNAITNKIGALSSLLGQFRPTVGGEVALAGKLTTSEERINDYSEKVGTTDSVAYGHLTGAQKEESINRLHSVMNGMALSQSGSNTDTRSMTKLSSQTQTASDQLSNIRTLSEQDVITTSQTVLASGAQGSPLLTPDEARAGIYTDTAALEAEKKVLKDGAIDGHKDQKDITANLLKTLAEKRESLDDITTTEIDANKANLNAERVKKVVDLTSMEGAIGGGGETGSIMTQDRANEARVGAGELGWKGVASIDFGNGVTAVPTGLQGQEGTDKGDMTYSIYHGDSETPMYEDVALRYGGDGKVSMVQLKTDEEGGFQKGLPDHLDDKNTNDNAVGYGLAKGFNAISEGANYLHGGGSDLVGSALANLGIERGESSPLIAEEYKQQTAYHDVAPDIIPTTSEIEIGSISKSGVMTLGGEVADVSMVNINIGNLGSGNRGGIESLKLNDDGGSYNAKAEIGPIKIN